MKFNGLEVLVVGMARSGIGAVKLLHDLGAVVTINDSQNENEIKEKIAVIEGLYSQKILGSKPKNMDKYDLVVLSPGVPVDLDFLEDARFRGVKIIGELELGYLASKGDFIAITGTNGKTTTTTLVGEIFKNAKIDTEIVGNIGYPVVEKALESSDETVFVTEVSSFQLETIENFTPRVSAILNITPDHLNRHKTMKNYIESKGRVFENNDVNSFLVINSSCNNLYDLDSYNGKVLQFSSSDKVEYGAYLEDGKIIVEIEEKMTLCNVDELKIKGIHNFENVMAATLISLAYGLEIDDIRGTILAFTGVEHRIEYVGEINERYFYNDSKGTNPDATMIAIKAMDKKTVLILGGKDKGSEFTELIKSFGGKIFAVVALGDTKNKIKEACLKEGFDTIYIVENMNEAVRKSYEISCENMNILLSPACASWDMYENFEVRGKDFKDCVNKLRG